MKIRFSLALLAYLAVACTSDSTGSSDSDDDHDHGDHDHGATALVADCKAIIVACHPKDDGTEGEVHDCHVVAHDNDAADCKKQKADCLAVCKKAPTVAGEYPGGDASAPPTKNAPDAAAEASDHEHGDHDHSMDAMAGD